MRRALRAKRSNPASDASQMIASLRMHIHGLTSVYPFSVSDRICPTPTCTGVATAMNSGRLPLSRSTRIDGVEADIEPHALRDQALDRLAVGVVGAQQIDAGTERHHLDRDLVGIVVFQQIVGDAEHEALLARRRCRRAAARCGARRTACPAAAPAAARATGATAAISSAAIERAKDDRRCIRSCHPCPAMPGLSSTPFKVTPAPRRSGSLPDRRCLATTSQTGTPCCSLTEAQPATL